MTTRATYDVAGRRDWIKRDLPFPLTLDAVRSIGNPLGLDHDDYSAAASIDPARAVGFSQAYMVKAADGTPLGILATDGTLVSH